MHVSNNWKLGLLFMMLIYLMFLSFVFKVEWKQFSMILLILHHNVSQYWGLLSV